MSRVSLRTLGLKGAAGAVATTLTASAVLGCGAGDKLNAARGKLMSAPYVRVREGPDKTLEFGPHYYALLDRAGVVVWQRDGRELVRAAKHHCYQPGPATTQAVHDEARRTLIPPATDVKEVTRGGRTILKTHVDAGNEGYDHDGAVYLDRAGRPQLVVDRLVGDPGSTPVRSTFYYPTRLEMSAPQPRCPHAP